ncbi:hypothetical protein BMIN_0392 [Bifidobacterium minimum]|uniref:Uncharacterized protein n=1 Tax=Bifidobacterium minimum TaxID=1693 RepID=A0A087BN96_9BIFI|nr:hypothetical protein BMIN_0392 [Bifidobacterium minimum]
MAKATKSAYTAMRRVDQRPESETPVPWGDSVPSVEWLLECVVLEA